MKSKAALDILLLFVMVANVTVNISHLCIPQPHKEIRNVADDLCVYSLWLSMITETETEKENKKNNTLEPFPGRQNSILTFLWAGCWTESPYPVPEQN